MQFVVRCGTGDCLRGTKRLPNLEAGRCAGADADLVLRSTSIATWIVLIGSQSQEGSSKSIYGDSGGPGECARCCGIECSEAQQVLDDEVKPTRGSGVKNN